MLQSIIKLSFIFCLTSYTVCAQSSQEISFSEESISFAINTLVEDQRGLYNGPEYIPTQTQGSGHQFFLTDKLQEESIIYNGIVYDNIPLAYDLHHDQVVITNSSGNKICPVRERIDAFTVNGHHFKYVRKIPGLDPGYYDFLFDGSTSLCAQRKKVMRGFQWRELVTYYVIHPDRSISIVDDKKSLLAALAASQKDIRHFIAENKLNFRKNKERSLARVLEFYTTEN